MCRGPALPYSQLRPATVAAALAGAVAGPTLICEPEWSRRIAQEVFRRSRKCAVAAIANSKSFSGSASMQSCHIRTVAETGANRSRGPHWQLPFASYPAKDA